jgi:superfamily II DNA or RNA helicase
MPLTHSSFEMLFNPLYLKRGQDYFRKGMVIRVEQKDKGDKISANVRGSGRKTYHCDIDLKVEQGQVIDIQGLCSCPVHYNCKHVAAVLYQLLEDKHFDSADSLVQSDMFGMPDEQTLKQQLKTAQHNFLTKKATNRTSTDVLLYLLRMNYAEGGRFVSVHTAKTRKLKDGSYAPAKYHSISSGSRASFIDDLDRRILLSLEVLCAESVYLEAPLSGETGYEVLQMLIQSGRCHWQDETSAALKVGDPRHGTLYWEIQQDASQSVEASGLGDDCEVMDILPACYIDKASGECGLFETELDSELLSFLLSYPALPPEQVDTMCKRLQEQFPQQNPPLPSRPQIHQVDDVHPVPCLRLKNEAEDPLYPDEEVYCVAELYFEYNGVRVSPFDEDEKITRATDSGFEVLMRNSKFENDVINQLDRIGLIIDDFDVFNDHAQLEPVHNTDTWFGFMLNHRHRLLLDGWKVLIEEDFAFQFDEAEEWYATVDDSANDWFKLELGIEVDGQPINLLPFLVNYLDSVKGGSAINDLQSMPDDYPLILEQDNGRYLHVPLKKVRHIIDTLIELYDPDVLDDEGRLELSRYHSSQLSELAKQNSTMSWEGGEAVRKFGQKLQNFSGITEVPVPDNLMAELRDYQREGLNWLQFLREYELGGILADDMGLGKTVQALAHLLVEKQQGRAGCPSLVVAPTSLMVNWKREAAKFAPELKVLILQGADRKHKFEQIPEHDIVLTTYPLLSRDTKVLLEQEWHLAILDEAQHIKNPKSKAAQTASQLNAHHRLCLTGTPMENHLGELWSQFNFLMPGLLSNEKRFRKLFRYPIERKQDVSRQQQLRERVAPFMLRRHKSEVATELPPKTEILSEVELDGAQRDLYETIRVSMDAKVRKAIDQKGISRSQIVILDALLKLRQVCCHPQLLKIPSAKKVTQSAKLNQLLEMLPEMVEEGRRILLFSQFTSMLAIIEQELDKLKIDYVILTGQTRDRETPIDAFQLGKVPLFLISLKAGGSGLNLTAADTVIHYDPWWNPAAENQATDRAHRIGQDKPVFVYKMITAGTVEEKILEMQAKKQQLADALFNEGSKGGTITSDDLQALFEPIR